VEKTRRTQGWNEVASVEGRPGFKNLGQEFLSDGNTIAGFEANFETQAVDVRLWRAPSWAEINAAEAKDPPSPGYGGQGKAESKQQ